MKITCGIVGFGIYLPSYYMTAKELSEKSGIPVNIISDKMGIKRVVIPGENDHACEMALYAAKDCLKNTGIDAKEIDLIIYNGEDYKKHLICTTALVIQKEIGADHAWGFDISCRCAATSIALKTARDMMVADNSINTVLIAGGSANSPLVNYEDSDSSFMFSAASGGAAVILQRNYPYNELKESAVYADSMFADWIYTMYGRKIHPASNEFVPSEQWKIHVTEFERIRENLNKVTLDAFIKVTKECVEKSESSLDDIDYLAVTFLKPAAHQMLLNKFGLSQGQSTYLAQYGHLGCVDPILSIKLGLEEGKIKAGDNVLLLSAGIGFTWAASLVRWGG
ncbi:3-oxoacyl-[acyl-carrier-protein] synthase-3 [Anaerovirgula multivorans]|uniref:3-oxoacyl-[acyl-carrier-protein] synthase-3 n=1 Tax=Anaerovirgula multivorans TaxID=312168 RepID=A0A239J5E7_9FIRM|nr:3-oxoacyl-ACP synthase [Anaerovirgula multivorans]SNT01050.1 3-oxoacyl-[acyl-carrier-protein] synthase-3 [Anaerovirgula multivorans]